MKIVVFIVAVLSAALVISFNICLSTHSIKTNGQWGNICKEDNTCAEGLTCVYDNYGYSKVNRRSICLDKRTMGIN